MSFSALLPFFFIFSLCTIVKCFFSQGFNFQNMQHSFNEGMELHQSCVLYYEYYYYCYFESKREAFLVTNFPSFSWDRVSVLPSSCCLLYLI